MDILGPQIESLLVGGFGSDHQRILSDGRFLSHGAEQLTPLPWQQINQIAISFNEDIQVSQQNLVLQGTNTTPEIVGFTYDTDAQTAIWQFDQPLATDRYWLQLSDDITDPFGNALDGEWWDDRSRRSGNGISGGDFHYRFDVQIGDVDGSGTTDVRDYGIIQESITSTRPNRSLDLDFDLIQTQNDVEIVQTAFADTRAALAPNQTIETENIGDRNNNGVDDVAILQTGDTSYISRYDTNSIDELAKISLNSGFRFIDIEPILDEGEVEGLAVLGIHKQSGGVRVWTWDLESSSLNASYSFGKSIIPADLEIVDQNNSAPRILLLGEVSGTDNFRVWSTNTETGLRTSTRLARGFAGVDLETQSQQPSSIAEYAVAGIHSSTDGVRVQVFNAETNRQLANVSFGRVNLVDFELIDSVTSNAHNYAILRDQNASARVDVKSRFGEQIDQFTIQTDGNPQDLAAWSVEENGRDRNKIAVVSEHPEHFEQRVFVSTLRAKTQWERSFGSGYQSNGFAVVDIDGNTGIALSEFNANLGVQQLKVRLSEQNRRVVTIPISVDPNANRWFTANRVHGHTRLYPYHPFNPTFYTDDDAYNNAGQYFQDLGANVFTRHVRSYDENPWWPSEVPLDASGNQLFSGARNNFGIDLAAGENPIQRNINEAWSAGLPSIAYYSDSGEARVAAQHPEWVCQDQNGNVATHRTKGDYLDITGPYGQIVQQRLLELADMGSSGIYLDFRHLPPGGCWGTQLANEFTRTTGLEPPRIGRTAEYQQFIEFTAQQLTNTITQWQRTLEEEYPNVELITSVTSVPGLTRLDMASNLASIGSSKSEFSVALQRGQNNSVFTRNPELYQPDDDIRMAFGWSLLRDTTINGQPHIWNIWSPNGEQNDAFIAAVTTYGAIAALDVPEELLPPGSDIPGVASRQELANSFEFGNLISPHLANVNPLGAIAVHYSETARNSDYQSGDRALWENVNLPALGGFQAFTELGLSPQVLTDIDLTEPLPSDLKVLYLPASDQLTTAQQSVIAQFTARGGQIITNQDTWNWGTEAGYQTALEALQNQTRSLETSLPVIVEGLPDKVHAVAYTKQRQADSNVTSLIVPIVNDFTFVQKSFVANPLPEAEVNPSPSPVASGVKISIDRNFQPELSQLDASQIIAYDAVSKQELTVIATANGFEILLPSFSNMLVAVIEPVLT